MQTINHITSPKAIKLIALGIAIAVLGSLVGMRLTAQQPERATHSRILPVKVTTVTLETGYMARRTFTGRAVTGRTSNLAFELGGTLNAVYVDMGSLVKQGSPLAALDTARLNATRNQLTAEHNEVLANLDLAESTLKRVEEMFKSGHISAQKNDEAKANAIALRARENRLNAAIASLDVDISKATLHAPFTGTITKRTFDEGTVVAAGTSLLELTEISRMEAHIGMPPEHAMAIKNGADYILRGNNRNIIEGAKVRAVIPVIEGNTRTMLVTFDIPADTVARGELIHASVQHWQEANGAWLPLRALSSDVRGLWRVYKVDQTTEPAHVQFENVQILYSEPERAFVTGTISNDEVVIADGLERLAPGQRVSILPASSTTHKN